MFMIRTPKSNTSYKNDRNFITKKEEAVYDTFYLLKDLTLTVAVLNERGTKRTFICHSVDIYGDLEKVVVAENTRVSCKRTSSAPTGQGKILVLH